MPLPAVKEEESASLATATPTTDESQSLKSGYVDDSTSFDTKSIKSIKWSDTKSTKSDASNGSSEKQNLPTIYDVIAPSWEGGPALSQDGKAYVYVKLNLAYKSLDEIWGLQKLCHVRHLNLRGNKLTDLSALGWMPYLTELDVSHNCLERLLGFKAPLLLAIADFSYNYISNMPNLSEFWTLQELMLCHNQICVIEGLSELRYLRHLDVSFNHVSKICPMGTLPLRTLLLTNNDLDSLDGIVHLELLQKLDISSNSVTSMEHLTRHYQLRELDLTHNKIHNVQDLRSLHHISELWEVSMKGNPLAEFPHYREMLIFSLPNIMMIDNDPVTEEDRMNATLLLQPSMEYKAIQKHARQILIQLQQPLRITPDIFPIGSAPNPILVLVGPPCSLRTHLALHLCENLPGRGWYGCITTTRDPRPGETDKVHHFVTSAEFDEMENNGTLLVTFSKIGDRYGLARRELETAAVRRMVLVITLDLEAALTMKMSHPHARAVLVIAMDEQIHTSRLKHVINNVMTDDFPEWEPLDNATLDGLKTRNVTEKEWPFDLGDLNIREVPLQYLLPNDRLKQSRLSALCAEARAALDLREVYLQYNLDHPGMFYAVINSNSFQFAYYSLRKIIHSMFCGQLTLSVRPKTLLQKEVERKKKESLLYQLRTANPTGIPVTPYADKAFV